MMVPRSPPLRTSGAPLGLVPFTVPGWPDETGYRRAFEQIACRQPASFEFALPSDGWSSRTNEVIARALAGTVVDLDAFTHLARRHRPNVAVIYEGSARRIGRADLLARLSGAVDDIMLEWEPETHASWAEDAARHGIGLVTTLEAGGLSAAKAEDIGRTARTGAIVYLKCAEKTAGTGCGVDVVRAACDRIKACRRDIFVMAGFGIREPDQVRALAGIDTLDAVAVGTALLERFAQGVDAVGAFYGALTDAAGAAA
jgi:tryptophan synthase alpha subunit